MLEKARSDVSGAKRRHGLAAARAIAVISGGGLALRYRRADDVYLGCRCLASLAVVAHCRFGDEVMQLLASRIPQIVRDSLLEDNPGRTESQADVAADKGPSDSTVGQRESSTNGTGIKLASVSAMAKLECMAL